MGDKKYADPTNVLKSITDDSGSPIVVGDEKDIGEFNDSFLSRVQEGLNYKKLYDEMIKIKRRKERKMEKKQKDIEIDDSSSVYCETDMNSSICVDDINEF